MPKNTITTCPEWVAEILDRCQSDYIGDDGVLVTILDSNGRTIDSEPLIADFGDVLPFAWHFGAREFCLDQLKNANSFLSNGLYERKGRVQLFFNHDWLLGLLDLYRQTGDDSILRMAIEGGDTIGEQYFCKGVLVDELAYGRDWRTWLGPASPFNGGYLELWSDLYKYTGNEQYVNWSRQLADGWIKGQAFQEHGILVRCFSARSKSLNRLLGRMASLRSRLFKDNTNFIWGLLSTYKDTGDPDYKRALLDWVEGFEKYFWNNGQVFLMLDTSMNGYNPSIKAAFSSLDLLCDLYFDGVDGDNLMRLGCGIADYWLDQQWESGLFPETPGGGSDHLDANVDLTVALYKLAAITGQQKYSDAANRCMNGLLSQHKMEFGYCMSVNPEGTPVDKRIIVKYQGLLTKLALLPDAAEEIFKNEERLELLRDR